MKLRVMHLSFVIALVASLLTPATSYAESTNRSEVREGLAQGGWKVVYGDLINEADYALFIAAVAGAVVCECPGPIYEYFDSQSQAQIDKITASAPEIAQDALIDLLIQAFDSNGQSLRHGRLEVSGGLATYKRWETVIYDEPRTYKCGNILGIPCTTMERVERTISYPNNFQPYFRFRFISDSGSPGGAGDSGTGAGGSTATVVCASTYPTRLRIGDRATVSLIPPLANLVRSLPEASASVLGRIQPGEGMTILAGPECANGRIWWYVRSDNNVTGWTGEGDSSDYWLIPDSVASPPAPATLLPIESCRPAGAPVGAGRPVMHHYGVTEVCTVGPMVYYLVDKRPPVGAMPGEDCVAFNPQQLQSRPDMLAIFDGQRNVTLFWPFERGEQVTNAYNIIRHHGFTHACYLERGALNKTYLRQ